jgi:hypothetical protein
MKTAVDRIRAAARIAAAFCGRCVACDRPARRHARVCVYCGEAVAYPAASRALRVAVPTLAAGACAALLVLRAPALGGAWLGARVAGCPWTCALLALALGLLLLPPRAAGVAPADRRDGRRRALSAAAGGLALVIAAAACLLAAAGPQPWTRAETFLAALAFPALGAAPLVLGLSWSSLAAGLCIGAALTCGG